MDLQEDSQQRLVQAYDLAEYNMKSELKNRYGGGQVLYVISQCRKGIYTKNDVVVKMIESLKHISHNFRTKANIMCDQIASI